VVEDMLDKNAAFRQMIVLVVPPGQRVIVRSRTLQGWEEAMLARARERFEADLADLHDGLGTRNRVKRYERVIERIGRLRERHAMVGAHHDIEVTRTSDRGDARAGLYVLRTSHTDWDIERTVRTYWRLTELEASFEALRSELGLRPVRHRQTGRIRGHMFIAVLALYGVNLIRTRLAARGIHHGWEMLRNRLDRWWRSTTAFTETDGSRAEVRQDARPDPDACGTAEAAGTPWKRDRRSRRLRRQRPA